MQSIAINHIDDFGPWLEINVQIYNIIDFFSLHLRSSPFRVSYVSFISLACQNIQSFLAINGINFTRIQSQNAGSDILISEISFENKFLSVRMFFS